MPLKIFSRRRIALCAVLILVPVLGFSILQEPLSTGAASDPIARLQQRIAAGEVKLDYDSRQGYLPSLLESLKIPISSQGLVFSKTSLQVDRIAPWTPRALYFNEDVYVGWVVGGPIIEIASIDRNLGAVFYTLDQEPGVPPAFRRETTTCLMCHSSQATGGVPGLIVRSVHPDRYGYVIPTSDKGPTTDRTPIEDRWGGWYVTGTTGDQLHMGNMLAPTPAQEIGNPRNFLAAVDLRPNVNVTDLSGRFNTRHYLSPHSDVVALLVVAHQAYIHNLITKTAYEAAKSTVLRTDRAESLVRALLFAREAPLAGPVEGPTDFATDFVRQGIRDSRGRSLRDLDLNGRLFKYPLSYLVYSDSFNALPRDVKQYVYRRFREVLTGEDRTKEFSHLSDSDRTAILEILQETKPDFAE